MRSPNRRNGRRGAFGRLLGSGFTGLATIMLASCAQQPLTAQNAPPATMPAVQATVQPAPAVVTPPPAGAVQPVAAQPQQSFPAFIQGLKADARAQGVSDSTLNAALDGLHPLDDVVAHDKTQPETTLTFATYVTRVVNPARIAAGQQRYDANRDLLAQVQQRYGVSPGIVVALWGIESDFGHSTGGYPVIAALATMAYEGRRAAFFRSELLAALKIADGGALPPAKMSGSWAGAMGQSQFMPTTYLHYAASWSGTTKPDIWTNTADVFASAANYLHSIGWKPDQKWGRPVAVTVPIPSAQLGTGVTKTIDEWSSLGVRAANGARLPASSIRASLIQPAAAGDNPSYFLVYDNFNVIMKWNHSTFFALAAGTLADAIENR